MTSLRSRVRERPGRASMRALVLAAPLFLGPLSQAASAQLTLRIRDYAVVPMSGAVDGQGNGGSLARVNFLREEPGGADRLFVNDLNGRLYILDKTTKAFTPYLDFNGRGTAPGIFDKLHIEEGYANGLITFQFDPAYRTNGRFYTIHLEESQAAGSVLPDATSVSGLDLTGYETTAAVDTPGGTQREAVLIEWTDTSVGNTTFEGTARELLRVEHNSRIHPMGDLIFNPLARPGDPDWRVLYIACGDGGSGEQQNASRLNPQRLDTLVGKILRIVPDLAEHTATSTIGGNGRYRVPEDNPFVNVAEARPEIWAVGLRNPHRLTWDVDPDRPENHRLIAATVGLHTWEAVHIIHKGANYGYPFREGNEGMGPDNLAAPRPDPDRIPVHVTDVTTNGDVTPAHAVARYPHSGEGGDAISGGFVYRGAALPALRGKYLFGDITTGRIWYLEVADMLAADDADPETLAPLHEVAIEWDDPADAPDAGATVHPSMFPIALAAYRARGGLDPDLPGRATVSGTGRADIRFAVDADGELYILSKTDGAIRAVVGVQ